jgi:hypothetical protein
MLVFERILRFFSQILLKIYRQLLDGSLRSMITVILNFLILVHSNYGRFLSSQAELVASLACLFTMNHILLNLFLTL